MTATRILPAAIEGSPYHIELPPGMRGHTVFDTDGGVKEIHTPPDILVRVHELLHARYTNPDVAYGSHPFVQQVVEDMRLHSKHWPWKPCSTPRVIANAANQHVQAEYESFSQYAVEHPEMPPEQRGYIFGCTVRNNIVERFIDGDKDHGTYWMTPHERDLAYQIRSAICSEDYALAAYLLENAYFPPPPEGRRKPKPKKEQSKSPERKDDHSLPWPIRKGRETVVRLHDQGPFLDRCGDPMDDWTVTTSGPQIHRPALRRPILPQRLFRRRRPVEPGGAILIDASGSMELSPDDLVAIVERSPQATLAIYSGNDEDYAPEGDIWVFAKQGFRLPREKIARTVKERKGGNSIDLQAMEWLLKQPAPRVMVTDREFCGSYLSQVAHVRLAAEEAAGNITVIENGRELLPEYVESLSASSDDEEEPDEDSYDEDSEPSDEDDD